MTERKTRNQLAHMFIAKEKIRRSWKIKLFLKIRHLLSGKSQIIHWLLGQEGWHSLDSSPNRSWVMDLDTKRFFGKWFHGALWEGRDIRQVVPWMSGAQACWETSETLWELRENLARIPGCLIHYLPSLIVNGFSGNMNSTSCPPLNDLRLSHSHQMPSDRKKPLVYTETICMQLPVQVKNRAGTESTRGMHDPLRNNCPVQDLAMDQTYLSNVQLKSMWQVNLS